MGFQLVKKRTHSGVNSETFIGSPWISVLAKKWTISPYNGLFLIWRVWIPLACRRKLNKYLTWNSINFVCIVNSVLCILLRRKLRSMMDTITKILLTLLAILWALILYGKVSDDQNIWYTSSDWIAMNGNLWNYSMPTVLSSASCKRKLT